MICVVVYVCVAWCVVLLCPRAGNSWTPWDMTVEAMCGSLSLHLSWDTWSLISAFSVYLFHFPASLCRLLDVLLASLWPYCGFLVQESNIIHPIIHSIKFIEYLLCVSIFRLGLQQISKQSLSHPSRGDTLNK